MTLMETWRHARGSGKKTAARLARRMLPRTTLTLVHVEPDLRLMVNLRRHLMFWSGGLAQFEPYAVRVLRAAIEPGDQIFDIGANIGFFSTLFSRWVGDEGRVVAVEPEPENLALLRRNLERNRCGNVTVSATAVGACEGTAPFSLDEATGATGHLGRTPTEGERAVGSGKVQIIEMKIETIDGLVERLGRGPQVLKMDIEGGEIHALEGAARTLAEERPIVVSELNGEGGPIVVARLAEAGYRMWDLESSRPVADDQHPFMVVAIPGETLDGERARRIQDALHRPRIEDRSCQDITRSPR
jgi:FkbM family methyltransferase